jgi:glycosyltransferase involved in cell wall biosynthesis
VRIALAVHGYPPELYGGTELGTRALARALAGAGHRVLVIAGSLERRVPLAIEEYEDEDPVSGARVEVRRVHRDDLYFDHWHKGKSGAASSAVDGILEGWRPDVLHVQHWLRLSTDLVRVAARRGVPAVVALHDHFTSCLLGWRAHPGDRAPCARPFDALGCVPCAGGVPPRTPWVPLEQQLLAFGTRAADVRAELGFARAVLVPSEAHGEALLRARGEERALLVVPPLPVVSLAPRAPLPLPQEHGALRLGAWGLAAPGKGAALLADARDLAAARARLPIELVLAGAAAGDSRPGVACHPRYRPEELQTHPVTDVHAALSGSLAPESHGLVADEALALGLPLVLPRSGAFAQRFRDGRGVRFYEPGDVAALARVFGELALPGHLDALRARPAPPRGPGAAAVLGVLEGLYERLVAQGAPDVPPEEWFEARLRASELAAWDDALGRTPPADLGFPPAP